MDKPRHRAEPCRDWGRVGITVMSTLLAVLLLTGGGGTWSNWYHQTSATPGRLVSGAVSLKGKSLQILLLSKQTVGSRTYASAVPCQVPTGYLECRDVTDTLSGERLIPGDTLRLTRVVTLNGTGNNLKGDVVLDASRAITKSASPFAASATVTYRMTDPSGATATPTDGLKTFPVVRRTNTGFGDFAMQVEIATASSDAGSRWDQRLTGQSLAIGPLTATFTQTAA